MKAFTIFLTTAPYNSENTLTAARIAGSALQKGHRVNLIASGDGVYNFLKGQKARGVPHAADIFSALIEEGLMVYI